MPSTALVLVVALATASSAQEEGGGHYIINKKGLRKLSRRAGITHIEKAEYRQGLEEDVVFWTKMIRNTQEMSYPVPPAPVPTTDTLIPTIMVIDPTDPPLGVNPGVNTLTPTSLINPTDPPVGGGSFIPTSIVTDPPVVIEPTNPPVIVGPPIANTLTPTIDLGETIPPNTGVVVDPPTEPPASGGDFKCPDANFVGCTAVDPSDPVDECPTVGEPCPDSTGGEFCCLDACPRNYCTAKQSPSSVLGEVKFFVPLQFDEIP